MADSVGEAEEGGKRRLALGANPVQAEGQGRQGEVPQLPLSRAAGLSRFPKGWRTAEIITSTTSARDRAQLPGQEGWVGV